MMEIVGRLAAGFMRCARICQQLDTLESPIPVRVSPLIPLIQRLWILIYICCRAVDKIPGIGEGDKRLIFPATYPLLYPQPPHRPEDRHVGKECVSTGRSRR